MQLVGLFTVGGLKGAISIALVLMLQIARADQLVALTGVVVLFSIVVQGLILPFVIRVLDIDHEIPDAPSPDDPIDVDHSPYYHRDDEQVFRFGAQKDNESA